MRTFGSTLNTEKNRARGSAPFITLDFLFPAGTLHVSERGNPVTIDGGTHYAIAEDLSQLGSSFGRGSDGSLDIQAVELKFINLPVLPNGRLSNYFGGDLPVTEVDVWINFILPDDVTIVRFKRTSGVAQSATSVDFVEVSLRLTALWAKWLDKSVLRIAGRGDFPGMADFSLGRGIPLTFGKGEGARVPCLNLDTTLDATKLTVCERPPIPDLFLQSIDAIYYKGHLILEEDIIIAEDPGVSETLPLYLQRGGGGEQWGEKYEGFGPGFYDPTTEPSVLLGRDRGSVNTPSLYSQDMIAWQPFRYDYDVNITGAEVAARASDSYSPNVVGALAGTSGHGDNGSIIGLVRPMQLLIMDSSIKDQYGIVTIDPEELGAYRRAIGSSPTQFYDNGTFQPELSPAMGGPFEWNGEAPASIPDPKSYFDLHGWHPIPGHQYYAALLIAGADGVPDDPGNQWYDLKVDPFGNRTVATNFGQPTQWGDAFVHTIDRSPISGFPFVTQSTSVNPVGGQISMRFRAVVNSRSNTVETDEYGGDSNNVGAIGIFQQELVPEAARVIVGVDLEFRRRGVTGTTQVVPMTGSVTIAIYDTDANGHVRDQLASVNFSADEVAGIASSTTAWATIFKQLSDPVLMEEGKKYWISVNGEVDQQGSFSGWAMRSVTDPVIPAGVTGSLRAGVEYWHTGPQVTTQASQSVALRMGLRALKFTRNVDDTDATGHAVATITAYVTLTIGGVDQDVPFKLNDDGAVVQADVTASATLPADIGRGLLLHAGVPDARIAPDSESPGGFQETNGFFRDLTPSDSYHPTLAGAVVDQITFKELLARLAFESRCAFDWEDDVATWHLLPDPSFAAARTLTLADLAQGDRNGFRVPVLAIPRTDIHDVVNLINMLFQKDYSQSDAFFAVAVFADEGSIGNHGPLEQPALFKMRFIRTDVIAAMVGSFYIQQRSVQKRLPQLTTWLQTLELQKDDVIGLDIDDVTVPSGGTGGTLGDSSFGGSGLGMSPGSTGKFDGLNGTKFAVIAVRSQWQHRQLEYILRDLS